MLFLRTYSLQSITIGQTLFRITNLEFLLVFFFLDEVVIHVAFKANIFFIR